MNATAMIEETLKGILNFARQALVPENAISRRFTKSGRGNAERSVNYDAIKSLLE